MLQPKQSQRANSPLKRSLLLSSLRRRLHLPSSPPSLCAGQSAGTAYAGFATSDSCRCARARTGSTHPPYPGRLRQADRFLRSTAASVLRYIRAAGPCLRKRPITRICKAANRTASRDGLVLTAVCRLKRTRSTTVWLLPVLSARSLSHSSV